MSKKINPKDLTYSKKLPPFIAALHGQIADDGPDPILASHRRAVKPRSKSEEAEDAPLVLDGNGDVISGVTVGVDGGATMAASTASGEQTTNAGSIEGPSVTRQDKKEVDTAVFGRGGKKRKVGKLIGAASGESDEEEVTAEVAISGQSGGNRNTNGGTENGGHAGSKGGGQGATSKGKKKKTKKIKLSFEDEEG